MKIITFINKVLRISHGHSSHSKVSIKNLTYELNNDLLPEKEKKSFKKSLILIQISIVLNIIYYIIIILFYIILY